MNSISALAPVCAVAEKSACVSIPFSRKSKKKGERPPRGGIEILHDLIASRRNLLNFA